ncbi:DUF2695 domain-containing protein [Priestia sp. TSO9]|uniref:DUF2695 domain-containing protein n=1 Tax=Priestia sp. TSO9 TaxID=2885632 RepID=UPI001E45D907|nr:DUF2695 domain-containing protein [Priestia sp. TSO9]
MDSLLELKDELIKGQKLAMQGSYQRRAPSKKAIPHLLSARKGLKEYVEKHATDAFAWQLLSQAEEYLLNYNAALSALQNAVTLNKKDRKLVKKLVLLKEQANKSHELDLSPEELDSLEAFLDEKVDIQGCDHTLIYTKEWLDTHIPVSKKSKVVKALQNQGGFCDCEVLMNVID